MANEEFLHIMDIEFTPSEIYAGTPIAAKIQIKNDLSEPGGITIHWHFEAFGKTSSEQTKSGVGQGTFWIGWVNFIVPYGTAPGRYPVKIFLEGKSLTILSKIEILPSAPPPPPPIQLQITKPLPDAHFAVGEDIQFDALISGGVPPYDQLAWFANNVLFSEGVPSTIHSFDIDGKKTVVFRAGDSTGAVEWMVVNIWIDPIGEQPPEETWWEKLQRWAREFLEWLGNIELALVNQIRTLIGLDPILPDEDITQAEWIKFIPGASALSKLAYGMDLDGNPSTTLSTGEAVSLGLALVPIPIGRLANLGSKSAQVVGAKGYLTMTEQVMFNEGAILAKGAAKLPLWRAIAVKSSNAFKWLFGVGKGKGIPGVFTISELPQQIAIWGFLIIALRKIFGTDPPSVGYKLSAAKDAWEGNVYLYLDAKEAGNKDGMITALNNLKAARTNYKAVVVEFQNDLETQGFLSSAKQYEIYMDQAILDYATESGVPPEEPPIPPTGFGTLNVSSTPTGAKIFIDFKDKFTTTPAILTLSSGIHQLSLILDGYHDHTQSVNVVQDQETQVNVLLTATTEPPPTPPPVEPPGEELEVPLLPSEPFRYNAWKITIKAIDGITGEELEAWILINDIFMARHTPAFFYLEPISEYNIKLRLKGYSQGEVTFTTKALPESPIPLD